jgi:hypothetical protein
MLIIRKSRIPNAGKGLFTTSAIRKGDLIVEYKGEKMTWDQCLKRYDKEISNARYLYFVSSKNCIDAQYTPNELARYANDAGGFIIKKGLSNNAEYKNIKGVPHIIATKKINPRSEILVDYSGDYWELMKKEMKKGHVHKVPAKKSKPAHA